MIYKPPAYLCPIKHHKAFHTIPQFARSANGKKIHKNDARNQMFFDEDLIIFGLKFPDQFARCENFWYIDNGYYRRSEPRGAFNGYYRILRSALYGDGSHTIDREHSVQKFNSYNLPLKKWRGGTGSKIVLVPPTDNVNLIVHEYDWLPRTREILRQYTDRPMEISTKQKPINWNDDIWCIVTCFSNIQTDALIEGVPVITTKYTNIGSLDQIENPPDESSREVLYGLAGQQWTLKEMGNGTAWRELNYES